MEFAAVERHYWGYRREQEQYQRKARLRVKPVGNGRLEVEGGHVCAAAAALQRRHVRQSVFRRPAGNVRVSGGCCDTGGKVLLENSTAGDGVSCASMTTSWSRGGGPKRDVLRRLPPGGCDVPEVDPVSIAISRDGDLYPVKEKKRKDCNEYMTKDYKRDKGRKRVHDERPCGGKSREGIRPGRRRGAGERPCKHLGALSQRRHWRIRRGVGAGGLTYWKWDCLDFAEMAGRGRDGFLWMSHH